MAFGRFKTPTTPATSPAPAPAPAPTPEPKTVTVQATVVQETPAPAPAPAKPATPAVRPAGSGVPMLVPKIKTSSVLAVIAGAAKESEGGGGELFPTLVMKGGNSGGMFGPSGLTPKEVGDQLPQGRQSIKAIFMAFRTEIISWPMDQDSAPAGTRPVFNVAVGPGDAAMTEEIRKGCHNFQVTPKDLKASKWAAAAGGPGYLRPVFQLLVYLPQFDDVIVVQLPPLYKSWGQMAEELGQFKDGDGELAAFPCQLEATTADWYEDNKYHYFAVKPWTGADAIEAANKYAAFVSSVPTERPDLAEAINDWFSGADKPLSDLVREKLKLAADMVPPRRRRD